MKRVVCIPGEDAAPEAFEPTVELVSRMKLGIEWLRPPVGEVLFGENADRGTDRRGERAAQRRGHHHMLFESA